MQLGLAGFRGMVGLLPVLAFLLARQAGFEVPPDADMEGRFAELHFLEHSVGRTGLLAMSPMFHFSDRDLWQYHMIARR